MAQSKNFYEKVQHSKLEPYNISGLYRVPLIIIPAHVQSVYNVHIYHENSKKIFFSWHNPFKPLPSSLPLIMGGGGEVGCPCWYVDNNPNLCCCSQAGSSSRTRCGRRVTWQCWTRCRTRTGPAWAAFSSSPPSAARYSGQPASSPPWVSVHC